MMIGVVHKIVFLATPQCNTSPDVLRYFQITGWNKNKKGTKKWCCYTIIQKPLPAGGQWL